MHILSEVAIDALHALSQMDVQQMHRLTLALRVEALLHRDAFARVLIGVAFLVELLHHAREIDTLLQQCRSRLFNLAAVKVAETTRAIPLVNRAEDPAVSVEVGKLRL